MDICPAGDAAKDTLLLGQAASHGERIVVADADALCDLIAAILALKVEVGWDKPGAGSLNLVRSRRQFVAGQRLRDYLCVLVRGCLTE